MKKQNLKHLIQDIKEVVHSARSAAARNVNTLQVMTNFKIGQLIVEHEQMGQKRALYGQKMLPLLSSKLTFEFGRGFSEDNLSLMRRFYLMYSQALPHISEKASRKFSKTALQSENVTTQRSLAQFVNVFKLSWSHYVFLMSINDKAERGFYEIESANSNWSLPELKRQYSSSLYERLALSRNKTKVKELAEKGQLVENPVDVIKNPMVLEFLGLKEQSKFSESDLESAIINRLEDFLLEIGKGFLFEARQKRFTFDSDHFFVDLVFYNRLLRCYVLIDLKLEKLTHQDLGQMQMYVNYFDRHVRQADEHPTIGIILCKSKNGALVELTLPKDANIYASEYKLYLPSKKELQKKLIQWTRELQKT